MEIITYKKTEKTPEVIIDYNLNSVAINGICTPENPKAFFDPIVLEIVKLKTIKNQIIFNIYLEYFNTSSSKCILNLIRTVSADEFKNIEINWIIETGDEELLEAGEVFEEITKLKFNYKFVDIN